MSQTHGGLLGLFPSLTLIEGETVTVYRDEEVGRDGHNNPITEETSEEVENVLVAPGPRNDVTDTNRPHGTKVVYTLQFPKRYPETLRGARISVRGEDPLDVVGDPRHSTEANTPGPWSMTAEVERTDG